MATGQSKSMKHRLLRLDCAAPVRPVIRCVEPDVCLDSLARTCIIMHVRSVSMNTPAITNSKVATLHQATASPEGDFLLSLGKRVRELRRRRGMTRKMVAREAEVSERHLAQLEVGEGNVSIVLLGRIAAALNVSLVELFTLGSEEKPENQLIQRFLDRLPDHRLRDVVSRLMRAFGPRKSCVGRAS